MKRQRKDFKKIKNRFSNRYNTFIQPDKAKFKEQRFSSLTNPFFIRLAPSVHYQLIQPNGVYPITVICAFPESFATRYLDYSTLLPLSGLYGLFILTLLGLLRSQVRICIDPIQRNPCTNVPLFPLDH